MPLTSDVAPGSIASSAWANEIRDRTIQVFDTLTDITTWPAPVGSFAFNLADGQLYTKAEAGWQAYVTRMGTGRLIVPILELGTSSPTYITTTTTDMALSNVPVIANHTYGIHLHTVVKLDLLDPAARWDFYIRWNGVDHRRAAIIEPGVGGTTYWTIDATVFWKPVVTAATDDISLQVREINDGANITLSGGTALTRTLAITDLGQP